MNLRNPLTEMFLSSEHEVIYEFVGESGETVTITFTNKKSLQDHEASFHLGKQCLEIMEEEGYKEAALRIHQLAEEQQTRKTNNKEIKEWLEDG